MGEHRTPGDDKDGDDIDPASTGLTGRGDMGANGAGEEMGAGEARGDEMGDRMGGGDAGRGNAAAATTSDARGKMLADCDAAKGLATGAAARTDGVLVLPLSGVVARTGKMTRTGVALAEPRPPAPAVETGRLGVLRRGRTGVTGRADEACAGAGGEAGAGRVAGLALPEWAKWTLARLGVTGRAGVGTLRGSGRVGVGARCGVADGVVARAGVAGRADRSGTAAAAGGGEGDGSRCDVTGRGVLRSVGGSEMYLRSRIPMRGISEGCDAGAVREPTGTVPTTAACTAVTTWLVFLASVLMGLTGCVSRVRVAASNEGADGVREGDRTGACTDGSAARGERGLVPCANRGTAGLAGTTSGRRKGTAPATNGARAAGSSRVGAVGARAGRGAVGAPHITIDRFRHAAMHICMDSLQLWLNA